MKKVKVLVTTVLLLTVGCRLSAQPAACGGSTVQTINSQNLKEDNGSKTADESLQEQQQPTPTAPVTHVSYSKYLPMVPCQPRAPKRGQYCGTAVYATIAGLAIVTAFAIIGGVFATDPAHAHPGVTP